MALCLLAITLLEGVTLVIGLHARDAPAIWLMSSAMVLAIAAIGLSFLLRFDARLFRMMADYPDQQAGGAAVDAYLAEIRVKPAPATVRPLADRIMGARRWMRGQLILATVSALLAILALIANFA